MRTKFKIQELSIYIYMISIFFIVATGESWMNKADIKIKYILSILFILISILLFVASREIKISKKLLYYFGFSILPYIVILGFEIFNYMFKNNYNYQESLKYIIYWTVPIILALFALRIFGKKAIDYTFYPMAVAYIITIIYNIYINGLGSLIYFFKDVTSVGNILESHALIFTFGLFLIYYMLFDKKSKGKVILLSLFIMLGFKRIEIIAIILILIFYNFFVKCCINKVNFKKSTIILGILLIIVLYIYIYMIQSGMFSRVISKYGINTMSRLEAYEYFNSNYELSITYLGKGVGYVNTKLSQVGSILRNIGDLHNDILKDYIEFGCIGFIVYFINLIILQSSRISKKMNYKSAIVYLILTIFSIILYATDNVSRYLTYQLVFIIIPYAHYLKTLEDEKIGEDNDKK